MFEIGYAIAVNKRVWLTRDESYAEAKKDFEQLRLLTTIGFARYVNSEQIIKSFFSDRPQQTLSETIFKQSIEPLLEEAQAESIVYLKSRHDSDASVRVTRELEDSGIPLIIDDPNETSVRPLHWYAQQLWNAKGMLSHFLSPAREGFKTHNARYALASGLAVGFHRNTLMLTEQHDMLAPMDYRDMTKYYTTPGEAAQLTEDWLLPMMEKERANSAAQSTHVRALRLATELKDFHVQLGDYVAENESGRLEEYFVETTTSTDVINGTHSIFVGRKGTGKTANLIHAQSAAAKDLRNLVCLIKPVGYEIEGLLRLFSRYKVQDQKGYVIESFWKFLLYTEIASAAGQQITQSALWELNDPDNRRLIELLEDESKIFSGDFIVRLERVVGSLYKSPLTENNEQFRSGISEALHSGAIGRLRPILAKVLNKKRHVLLLIDNLDKPWTKSADLCQLSEFLLGLLTATSRVGEEINKGERGNAPTKFNSAIFLRSDIFEKVVNSAREPDKIAYARIRWDDPELLLRIIEERYVASHGPESNPSTMWKNYFCPQVRGIPTRQYLVSRILSRPRDVVYLVKAVVSFAVNRKHDRVEEKDVKDGEKQYSQYALDSILVENGITIPQLESVLFEFVGAPAIVSRLEAGKRIQKAAIEPDKIDNVIEHLVKLSFLGVEVGPNEFAYADEPRELKKYRVLSDRQAEIRGAERRYQINAPFRAYLEIAESL